jgi:hypothetical protein
MIWVPSLQQSVRRSNFAASLEQVAVIQYGYQSPLAMVPYHVRAPVAMASKFLLCSLLSQTARAAPLRLTESEGFFCPKDFRTLIACASRKIEGVPNTSIFIVAGK